MQPTVTGRRSAARTRAALLIFLPGFLAPSACGAAQRPPVSFQAHDGPVLCLAFDPGGQRIATGTAPPQDATHPREAKLWRLPDATGEASVALPAGCGAMAFSPDGKRLAIGDLGGTVLLHELASGGNRVFGAPGSAGVTATAWSPDGATVAAGRTDGTVSLIDVGRMTSGGTLGEFGKRGIIAAVFFATEGHDLVVVSRDGWIATWDTATRREERAFRVTGRPIQGAALSPDGATLATAGTDKVVRLWSLASRQERAALTGHTRSVLAVVFSPDGRKLASIGQEGSARLWDLDSRKALPAFPEEPPPVAIAFSPDGRWLATGDGLGMVRIRGSGGSR